MVSGTHTSFPYHGTGTHIFRDSNMGVGLGNSMGLAYHKGVPLLGVPVSENRIDESQEKYFDQKMEYLYS